MKLPSSDTRGLVPARNSLLRELLNVLGYLHFIYVKRIFVIDKKKKS